MNKIINLILIFLECKTRMKLTRLSKLLQRYDVIELPQVPDYESDSYDMKLKNDEIYIISPSSDKIMKLAVEGETLSHTSGAYDKANLSMFGTVSKAWDVAAITNSIGVIIKLS